MVAPRPAVFLDRDGTIIADRDYLADPAGVELLDGAASAIRDLSSAGWPVVVVTNQSGIARGFFDEGVYHAVRRRLDEELARSNAKLLATYHCPHGPDTVPPCDCRKPAPGLFRRAAVDHAIDLSRSMYVGDRLRDLEPGIEAGGHGFLVHRTGNLPVLLPPDVTVVSSLREAADRILERYPSN